MQVDSKPEELDIDRPRDHAAEDRAGGAEEGKRSGLEGPAEAAREGACRRSRSSRPTLTARWKAEKEKLVRRAEAQERARRSCAPSSPTRSARGEYQQAGELAYGRIPELEKKLKDAEEQERSGAVVEEAVTADHIAQVVSRWTGIPVDRMLEGEREKLLQMEEQLGKRVVGQAEAVQAVSTAVRRARAGLAGSEPADRLVHVPRARPASARPS